MTKMDEYMKAREICDWIAEAKIQLEKGNIGDVQYWLDKAMNKAVGELLVWEEIHGVETGRYQQKA